MTTSHLASVPLAADDPWGLRLARLEALLDPVFLTEVGWDAELGLLRPAADHRLLGWSHCSVPSCMVETSRPLCTGCRRRQAESGLTPEEFIASSPVKSRGGAEGRRLRDDVLCKVKGCERPQHTRTIGLCNSHTIRCRELFGRIDIADVPLFLERPDVQPFRAWGPCRVVACLRLAYNSAGLCLMHSQAWNTALRDDVGTDMVDWCRRQDGVTQSGVANLRGLPRLVLLEFLGGLQLRIGQGRKTRPSQLNRLSRVARRQQVTTLADLDPSGLAGDAKTVLGMLVTEVDRATVTAGEEQRKDRWDLAVLGAAGTIDFTILTQPWLREVAKHWASEDIARRRGGKTGMVTRTHVGSLAELSTMLRLTRVDHGLDPTDLGRADIVAFLTRLGHLEQTGTLSAHRRLQIARHVRTVLRDARDLGLTRPGGCAAGLPGEFGVRAEDIPPPVHVDGPGRALPNEVMNALNDALPLLVARSGRTTRLAVEVLMDTGRRPDEICQLPLDCLERDGDGKYVLVYTDYKENRLHRRLPIPDSTAHLVLDQQAAVRAAFPDTDPAELALLPAASSNPHGTKSLRATGLTNMHRGWVDQLPPFVLLDGGVFPHAAVVAYAYRHTYAQRHADAGTPIEVLKDLMGAPQRPLDRGLLPDHRETHPGCGEQSRRSPVRRLRQPGVARRHRAARQRTSPNAGRPDRRPLRDLHRTIERPGRRRRLPVPVPLPRLRPLPHRRVLPTRTTLPPRPAARRPRARHRRDRTRSLGPGRSSTERHRD